MFGPFVKKIRESQGFSQQQFCKRAGLDTGNWSKIERELLDPPTNLDVLKSIAAALNIKSNSDEWLMLYDYAFISAGKIPANIFTNKTIKKCLHHVFKEIRNKESREALLEVITDR